MLLENKVFVMSNRIKKQTISKESDKNQSRSDKMAWLRKKSVWHGRKRNVIKFSCWKLTAIGFTSSTNQIQFEVKSAIIHCRWMDYAPFVEHCSSNLKCFTRCFVIIVWWKTVLGVYVCGAYVRLWLICLWWCEYWSTTTQPRRQKCMYSVLKCIGAGSTAGKPPLYQTNAVKIEG